MAAKLTPMLSQYRAIKAQYPDVILMFRLGDFYEMFGEDAIAASRELEIVLTSREVGKDGRMPMCGVPYHSAERYIARLVSRGYRVAICDQLEDPKKAKGLVRRDVTRVVTPGTVLEDGMLDAKSNNYLTAVAPGDECCGVAVVDITTGEFAVTEITGRDSTAGMLEEISRLAPAECLVREIDQDLIEPIKGAGARSVTPLTPMITSPGTRPQGFLAKVNASPPNMDRRGGSGYFRLPSKEMLQEHFGVSSLRGFGAEGMTCGLDACAMVLQYLAQTNPGALALITSLSTYSTSGFMILDAAARRNLELTQSMSLDQSAPMAGGRAVRGGGLCLLSVLDRTRTAMGGRLLRKWMDQPLLDVRAIDSRLNAVQELFENGLMRSELRDALGDLQDMERLMSRIVAQTATPRDLIGLKSSLEHLPRIKAAVADAKTAEIAVLSNQIDTLEPLVHLIASTIVDEPPLALREGGIIRDGVDEELDKLRKASTGGREWIANLEATERERTGIKSLKVGYNSVFGYYIEVTKPNLPLVPKDYIRKQTTANGERFITPELKEYEALVLGADEKIADLEYRLFCQVREKVADYMLRVAGVAKVLAELDVLASFAEVAVVNNYVRPEVNEGEEIVIRNGRHPIVEKSLPEGTFVPNDCLLNCESDRLLIITGPNMAGKSTYLRQVALITLMAQMGSFVPADSAHIGVVDRIFTRVGAHDELASGQSTFMVEMNETANILNNATRRSLVILDEIGRGTSTYDGLSIAWAVAERIGEVCARTLFATHYHHLNDLEKEMPGVRNYRIAVKEEADRIVWLRKIMPGGTDKSYGIEVARLAGLPQEVIERAKEILADLEDDGSGRLPDRRRRIPIREQTFQLSLFEVEPHPIIEELKKLDVSTMTPVEALVKLEEMVRRIKG